MKKIIIITALILLLLVGFSFIRNRNNDLQTVNPTETQNQVADGLVLIIFDGERPLVFNREFVEGQTAFSMLEEVAQKEEIELEIEQYDFGVFVKSIDGKESSAEMAWIYFVNGQSGQVAADQHELTNGDVVEWKYITPEE